MADSQREAEKAETDIGACLEPSTGGADIHRVYVILKLWYYHAYVREPNPTQTDMEKVQGDFQNLYQREKPHTSGLNLVTYFEPAKVNDKIPSEAEVESVVRHLHPHRKGVHTHLRTEHLKHR